MNGVLVPTAGGENRLAFGDTGWTNVKPDISGYCPQFDPGLGNKFVVRKVVNGAESSPIAIASMPPGFSVYGTPHDITIHAEGSHITVLVDGVKVLDFVDSTFASGGAGLRSWDGTATVGFISAKPLDGNSAGSGDSSKGDFACAMGDTSTSYGLVGSMAGNGAFAVQQLR